MSARVSRVPLPRPVIYVILVGVALSWLPLVFFARARVSKSDQPRVHAIQDMDSQARLRPQAVSSVFADRRAMRPQIPGTVARGQLDEDDDYCRGRKGDDWATEFPVEITAQVVQRGRERFDIFCATCHGMDGSGNGPVHQRAVELREPKWIPPTSMHLEEIRDRPVGHLFNTITHGIRNMPGYGSQIPIEDRWAIVAYVRALQLGRGADVKDVPADQRDALK